MPLFPVPGSEKFANRGHSSNEQIRASAGEHVVLHDVSQEAIDGVDPLTYEVVRHRLWAITEEMGDALKRMSGSVVVTDANDFDAAILDECGDQVQVGLYNTQLVASMDMAVKWTLENRAANPGIGEGDAFLTTDPWVGGGLHQNDASLFAPLFIDGELFAWTAATAHQVDLGGVSPGSWTVGSGSVFWESLPLPPIKIVSGGVMQADVEDSYLRRSRVPPLVALDLRAKLGASNVAQQGLRSLVAKYGKTTVKAVMRRMMNDSERRLREKLRSLPNGTFRSVSHQDQAREGDRGIYKIVLAMTKDDDRLIFDFTGTDPEVEGLINCTYAGIRGGIMPIVLTMLCGDVPWSPGGIFRCIEIISEPGTINNCNYPAGVSKGSVGSSWATQNAVSECIAGLIDTHPEHRLSLMSVCCGTWDTALLAGVDQRDAPFVTMLCDPMAGGMGARVDMDGVDTGGQNCIPMGRIADVEMNEFQFPLLYLWRREEKDSGGPGRFRGGVGASSCFVPHDTPIGGIHLVVSSAGKSVPMPTGLAGGYPGNTQHDVLVRRSDIWEQFAAGRVPRQIEELGGEHELAQPEHETDLGPDDVYFTHWQAGGGYGDPLLREPERVVRDVAAEKVSPDAAQMIYGVVLDASGGVDTEATETRRAEVRDARRAEATAR